jgi:23S rRNA pseudouridine1911/1915/1917 synthase
MPPRVIFEDNHLLVIDKPAGLATMGTAHGTASLVRQAKLYLKRKYAKPGNVFLGVVSRLDRPVSGVVVLARTSKAAARLARQFRDRTPQKRYLAAVEGSPAPTSGRLRDLLLRDDSAHRVRVLANPVPGSQEGLLTYDVVDSQPSFSLVEIQLHTGRKHQIRAQLSARGWPIWGDRLYGSRHDFSPGIALHAWKLTIQHPTLGTELSFVAHLPHGWSQFGFSSPSGQ